MKKMQELISVILPVYNVKEYVAECLESICSQTYKNLEIIIIDDGSTDGSELICDEYKVQDKRVSVIHQSNMGLSAARNTGLKASSGKYICFIDSDDYIESQYIEELYKSMKEHNVKIALCKIKELKDGNFYSKSLNLLNQNGEVLKGKDCIFNTYVWNKMYDASIWDNRQFDTQKWYEDIYITYQIMYPEERVAQVDQELYVYRKREGSISANVFDVDKTRDFLEASKQRMDFFDGKEKYLYDMCLDKYLGAIRQYYGALYIDDKQKNKNELKKSIKEYRKVYRSNVFKSKWGRNESIKNFVFYWMPNFFTKKKWKNN